jgi:hypothetical protein
MSVYYVYNKNIERYNIPKEITNGNKSITQLKQEISLNPDFCRDETSIDQNELKNYLNSGITFYALDENNILSGIVNFDINGQKLNIFGICVPGISQGFGSKLINAVKNISKINNITNIKLTCYGDNIIQFYLKNGFNIIDKDTFYDEDTDEEKTKYELSYTINTSVIGGKKYKKRYKTKKNKRKRNITIKRSKSNKFKSKRN